MSAELPPSDLAVMILVSLLDLQNKVFWVFKCVVRERRDLSLREIRKGLGKRERADMATVCSGRS